MQAILNEVERKFKYEGVKPKSAQIICISSPLSEPLFSVEISYGPVETFETGFLHSEEDAKAVVLTLKLQYGTEIKNWKLL